MQIRTDGHMNEPWSRKAHTNRRKLCFLSTTFDILLGFERSMHDIRL